MKKVLTVQVNLPGHSRFHDCLVGFVMTSEQEVRIQKVGLPIDVRSFHFWQVRFLSVHYSLTALAMT